MASFADQPDPRVAAPAGLVRTFDAFIGRLLIPPVAISPAHAALLAALAVGLAVWTDVLFRGAEGIGLNVPVWFGSLALAAFLAAHRTGRPLPLDRLAVLVTAVALSSVTAWRDSESLSVFGLMAAVGLLGLAIGLPSRLAVRRVSPVSCLAAFVACVVSLWTSEFRLALRVPWAGMLAAGPRSRVGPVARSLLIAAPILVVFGALFAAADAVFADQLGRLFAFTPEAVISHVFWLLFGLWVATALLWSAVAVDLPEDVSVSVPERYALGRLEVGIVLGSLATLFALFVLVQVRYLFGGDEAVQSSVHLTYAEYARRGFFELVVASLLLLPVLAAMNWARRQDDPSRRLFLLLALALTALLSVVMASAWQRLAMYVEAFGLTEGRFYALVVLPWLSATLAWFLVSVVRRRVEEVLAGAAALAVLVLFALYVISPDDVIVRTNTARAADGKPFDAAYAAVLSADAVPVLVSEFERMSPADRCILVPAMQAHESDLGSDVRTWNFSRQRAAALIDAHPEVAGCP